MLDKYKKTYPYKKDAEKYNTGDYWGDEVNNDEYEQIDDSNGDNNEFDDELYDEPKQGEGL